MVNSMTHYIIKAVKVFSHPLVKLFISHSFIIYILFLSYTLHPLHKTESKDWHYGTSDVVIALEMILIKSYPLGVQIKDLVQIEGSNKGAVIFPWQELFHMKGRSSLI